VRRRGKLHCARTDRGLTGRAIAPALLDLALEQPANIFVALGFAERVLKHSLSRLLSSAVVDSSMLQGDAVQSGTATYYKPLAASYH
jgi:hypothetical protein